jgi:hydroxymethylpyrimidine/phosphomethylpyrimidine kinase
MIEEPPVVLTIAGFDPSSGAGITADIKTIAAHGCYGVSVITALTVQSTAGVARVVPLEAEVFSESLNLLYADVKVSAVHIGMLGTAEIARRVNEFLKTKRPANVVLDPVLRSSSGAELLEPEGVEILKRELLPQADVVTPNADEAAALTGLKFSGVGGMKSAAGRLHEMGAKAVVVTGGHLESASDLLSLKDGETRVFSAQRVTDVKTHGTGCAFSSALACQLALGCSLAEAVELSKCYVLEAIRKSYRIGRGLVPVNHLYRFDK